jgi:hypothetical protein
MDHATPTADDDFDFDALLEASSLGAPRVTAALGTATPDTRRRFDQAARHPWVREKISAATPLLLDGPHRLADVRDVRERLLADAPQFVPGKPPGVYVFTIGSGKTQVFLHHVLAGARPRLAVADPGAVRVPLRPNVRWRVHAEILDWLSRRHDGMQGRRGCENTEFPDDQTGLGAMQWHDRSHPGIELSTEFTDLFTVLFHGCSRLSFNQCQGMASGAGVSPPVFEPRRYGFESSAVDADARAADYLSSVASMKRAALWLLAGGKNRQHSVPAWWQQNSGEPVGQALRAEPYRQKPNLRWSSDTASHTAASTLREAVLSEAAAFQLGCAARPEFLHQWWQRARNAPGMQQHEEKGGLVPEGNPLLLGRARLRALLRLAALVWPESPLVPSCEPSLDFRSLHAALSVSGPSSRFWQLSDSIWRLRALDDARATSLAPGGRPPLALRWLDASPNTESDYSVLVRTDCSERTSSPEGKAKQSVSGSAGAALPLPSEHEGQVLAELAGLLHLDREGGSAVGLSVSLRYRVTDPYAVEAVFDPRQGGVTWIFARDLLEEGMRTQAGKGDVKVWTHSAVGRESARTYLELSPSPDTALLSLPYEEVKAFLERTFALVPEGTEQAHLGASLLDLERQLHQLPAHLDSCD